MSKTFLQKKVVWSLKVKQLTNLPAPYILRWGSNVAAVVDHCRRSWWNSLAFGICHTAPTPTWLLVLLPAHSGKIFTGPTLIAICFSKRVEIQQQNPDVLLLCCNLGTQTQAPLFKAEEIKRRVRSLSEVFCCTRRRLLDPKRARGTISHHVHSYPVHCDNSL